jgi:hypothetical protein
VRGVAAFILVPVGVILPLWALSTWRDFPQFSRSDALVTCLGAVAVGVHAINFKLVFALRPKATMQPRTKKVYLALVLVLCFGSVGYVGLSLDQHLLASLSELLAPSAHSTQVAAARPSRAAPGAGVRSSAAARRDGLAAAPRPRHHLRVRPPAGAREREI